MTSSGLLQNFPASTQKPHRSASYSVEKLLISRRGIYVDEGVTVCFGVGEVNFVKNGIA